MLCSKGHEKRNQKRINLMVGKRSWLTEDTPTIRLAEVETTRNSAVARVEDIRAATTAATRRIRRAPTPNAPSNNPGTDNSNGTTMTPTSTPAAATTKCDNWKRLGRKTECYPDQSCHGCGGNGHSPHVRPICCTMRSRYTRSSGSPTGKKYKPLWLLPQAIRRGKLTGVCVISLLGRWGINVGSAIQHITPSATHFS